MTDAIFGLIGVIVGGFLTGFVSWLLERFRDKRAFRAIARLTYDDFLHYQATLVRALAYERWWDPAELLKAQASVTDRKLLLGQLDDAPSQEVAGAQGWMSYLISLRGRAAEEARRDQGVIDRLIGRDAPTDGRPPTEMEFTIMRDTFCRLDDARRELATVSGRDYWPFERGDVLRTLDPPRTREDLGISTDYCAERRQDRRQRAVL